MTYLSLTQQALLLFIACVNLYSFAVFFIDKQRAIKQQYRISEKHLLLSAVVGGVGASIAMHQFRHKTQKVAFRIVVPFGAILTVIMTILCII